MDSTLDSLFLFKSLYDNVNGYEVSRIAHKKLTNGENFLYGEITFYDWKIIVDRINPKKDGVFFDLGCGTGKAIIASHLLFNFRKSIGIELLEGLYSAALEIKENLEKTEQKNDGRELQFVKENIFDVDLSEADLIFLNYPLKKEQDFLRLEEKFLSELKPGTKIIATIRALKNPSFKSLGRHKYKFSWGRSIAYFYEV